MHPQTQGTIARWHRALKYLSLLENAFLEGELKAAVAACIDHCNNRRYRESIGNLTPADLYFGRGETILAERRRIIQQTIQSRRLKHRRKAACREPDGPPSKPKSGRLFQALRQWTGRR